MSWDLLVLRFAGKAPQNIDKAERKQVKDLGPAQQVRDRILRALPQVDWSDPSFGTLAGDGFSIEFNVGREAVIDNIMLRVRGEGNASPAIKAVVKRNGWALLDYSTGNVLDPDKPLPPPGAALATVDSTDAPIASESRSRSWLMPWR
jgi:hypothetical protein